MRAKQIFSFAWTSMKQRKLRTSLTTLGVVIGIAAIIGLASLGEGFRTSITARMQQGFELDVITVIPGSLFAGFKPEMGFSKEEVQKLNDIKNVSIVTGVIQIGNVTLYKENQEPVNAFVCTAVNFTEFKNVFSDRFIFKEGRLPYPDEDDAIVLGYKVNHANETELGFATFGDKINMTVGMKGIIIQNYTLTVKGVLEKKGTSGLTNFDYWVFISINKVKKIYEDIEKKFGATMDFKYHLIFIKVTDPIHSETVAKEVEKKFPRFQVTILVPTTFIRQVDYVLSLVQIFLTAIASISLIVAGIGIMNIMTVSVMERTREIGVMKAIGAKDRTILLMFLSEALLIGLLGGLIGVPVGYETANFLSIIISRFSQQQTGGNIFQVPERTQEPGITPILSPQWVIGAIIFGIVICVLFGLYPARKAAKLDPVKALRYE